MACNPSALDQGAQSSFQLFDQAEYRIYHMRHLCVFIQDVAAAAGPDRQTNDVKAESVSVVFGLISDELELASVEIAAARDRARKEAA